MSASPLSKREQAFLRSLYANDKDLGGTDVKRSLPRQLRDRAVLVRRRIGDGITAQLMEDAAEKILDLLARVETLERRKKAEVGEPPKAKHLKKMRENSEYVKSLKAARIATRAENAKAGG